MTKSDSWEENSTKELDVISKILTSIGFPLEDDQPHMSGERFLMMKEKFVLVGKDNSTQARAIIKVSRHPSGQDEIMREKRIHNLLSDLPFAGDTLLIPKEIYFDQKDGYFIWITEFLPQKEVFAAYPLKDKFFMALRVLEEQEAFHATTKEHLKKIDGIFGINTSQDYIDRFSKFRDTAFDNLEPDSPIKETFTKALAKLKDNKKILDMFGGYLAHSDFAPGNSRIVGKDIYLIDLSSIIFGNKYEGWARFLNWALLHDHEIEKLLLDYVKTNRGEIEYLCLQLMRIYKAGFLVEYYIKSLSKTSGDLNLLTKRRVEFWGKVLEALLKDEKVDQKIIDEYRGERNKLRSAEETERQKEFNIPHI